MIPQGSDIAILGAGGLGREIFLLLSVINSHKKSILIRGFYDDNISISANKLPAPLLGNINSIPQHKITTLIPAFGLPKTKINVLNSLNLDLYNFPTIIHPTLELSSEYQNVIIGKGSIITQGNMLTCDITIGDFVLINQGCSIGHDVKIGNYTSIMPGCMISGNVTIGKNVFLGTGAAIINGVNIADNATIGAGAVVNKDVEEGDTVMGIPAKIRNIL